MFSFRKSEKLCRKKIIDQLFASGRSFTLFPIRVQFLNTSLPDDELVQALFTVPKRRFKRAVKRNLLKRRMREAYRHNKSILLPAMHQQESQLAVAFIYVSNEEVDQSKINLAMIRALDRLIREIEKNR
jgi:ribonuclease P protein component